MLKRIDWNLVQAFIILLGIIAMVFLAAMIKLPVPDVVIPIPSEIPRDFYGDYWVLFYGSGSNQPGVHEEFSMGNLVPGWVRKEAMWVEPEPIIEWTWERDGEVRFQVQAKPGVCYQIGNQKVEVTIEKGEKYWDYTVTPCHWFKSYKNH